MLLSFHLQGEAVYLFRLQKYIKKMNSVTNGRKKNKIRYIGLTQHYLFYTTAVQ